MFNYDKRFFSKRANEVGFIRDTFEKVYRLTDILKYINNNHLLKEVLALKGGTAINLTVFNMPRLSVDIDLDYCNPVDRDEMLREREIINIDLIKYMQTNGYTLSPKTKNPFTLDSWIFEFINCGGNKDNIKIEINYSNRVHVLNIKERKIITEVLSETFLVRTLDPIELFGSKLSALINRAAVRDLYDVNNMIKYGLFDESEYEILKKCFIFYWAITSSEIKERFDLSQIDAINEHQIRRHLYPVIRKAENFDLYSAKKSVKEFIADLLVLTPKEEEFLNFFKQKEYCPELLFDNKEIIDRISKHPMALWKTMDR